MKILPGLLIAAVFATLTFAVWAALNRPLMVCSTHSTATACLPPWPSRIQGFAFSPFRANEDPITHTMPTDAEIDADLKLLKGKVSSLRTYGVEGTLADIPALADRYGMNVAVGALSYISPNKEQNEKEINTAIELARTHLRVNRLFIGNETVLRNDAPISQLFGYLDHARAQVELPVGTAEPWHVWLSHPELAQHVDFIGVHLFPYWEGVSIDQAVDFSFAELKKVQTAFPHKEVVVAEIGWPSRGRTRESAQASEANEALFLRRFLARAEQLGLTYYVCEAFDQPWKGLHDEGAVGAYWGVYDVNRKPKFEFQAPIVRVPEWHVLAAISIAVALLVLVFVNLNSSTLRNRGRSFLAIVVYSAATLAVWVFYDFTRQYMTVSSVVSGVLLLLGMLGVIMVLLAEAHEWAEAHWVTSTPRLGRPKRLASGGQPMVSIHVPAYNEPPDMLIQTLDALARLNYPDYEVLVIDNNTRDEAVWRPVEAHCQKLGPRFRFFHVAPLAGFKAGALNYALARTDERAQIVAVIDSDYEVEPSWLTDLVPAFDDPDIAIAQAPQDYRDGQDCAFKSMCYAEYRGFFHIGMITRNERNAIIQHGTMTLVRKRALQEVGGWAEWCITEDAELGLRLFERGYEATYFPQSYGRGLIPDTFIDFKKQRFRWAYGAMQILKRHARQLFMEGGPLSSGQRYHFIAGWLPWVADGFNMLFNLAALIWSCAMVYTASAHELNAALDHTSSWVGTHLPELNTALGYASAWIGEHFGVSLHLRLPLWTALDPPLLMYSVMPLSLFTFKLAKLAHLYRVRVGANTRQTLAAAVAGLALAHTIGVAVMKGLATRSEPFFRTPKTGETQGLWYALAAAREESLLMVALWLSAWAVSLVPPVLQGPDRLAWIVVLLIQSVPYASALVVSLASAFPLPARLLGKGYRPIPGYTVPAVVAPPPVLPPSVADAAESVEPLKRQA